MKEVKAYESNNGRLFHTEEECIKYENKLAQYPKVTITEEELTDWDNNQQAYVPNGIVKRIIKRQEKPSAQITRKLEYIVGKYTLRCGSHTANHCLEHIGQTFKDEELYKDYREAGRIVARAILKHKTLTTKLLKEIAEKFRNADKYCRMEVETVKTGGKHWSIDDPRWKYGGTEPLLLNIVKQEKN